MKKWITKQYGYAPILLRPQYGSAKLKDLSLNMIVETTDEISGIYEHVIYIEEKKTYNGWMITAYLEPYEEVYDTNCVDMGNLQTKDPNDFNQYFDWNGRKQVNGCGEMCVAYLLKAPLQLLLEHWVIKDPPFYKRIFGQGTATGTNADDLEMLFALYGFPVTQLSKALAQYTPHTLKQKISTHGIIASCHISKINGRLNGGGVGHWVVVTDVIPERTGYGLVYLFNPARNGIESYSWTEFATSARSPYGIAVSKDELHA